MLKRLLVAVIAIGLMGWIHGGFQYLGPRTPLHYAAGDSTGALGFNLADVSSLAALNALPGGDLGLVFIGTCTGADATFKAFVNQFNGNPLLWGFYIMDEPVVGTCSLANLKAEVDYIHTMTNRPNTFVVMENQTNWPATPVFTGYLTPSSTHLDYVGLDPYPVQTGFTPNGFDPTIIGAYVTAAAATGFTTAQLIPVYQAFGNYNGGAWNLPTLAQTETILSTWAPLLPTPAFDYAYAYGQQLGDNSIATTPYLQVYYAARNGVFIPPPPSCTLSLNFAQACNSQYIGVL